MLHSKKDFTAKALGPSTFLTVRDTRILRLQLVLEAILSIFLPSFSFLFLPRIYPIASTTVTLQQMLEALVQKLALYSGCAVPSIIFYLVTRNQTIKGASGGPPDWVLVLIGFIEVLVPVIYDGRGTVLDRVICAVMAIVMTSGMFFYVRDRQQTPEGGKIQPFYDILTHWNEAPSTNATSNHDHKKNDNAKQQKQLTLSDIRMDALKFLLRAVVYTLIYIPVFSTMDGFIRACREPPETLTAIPYIRRLFTVFIPFASTFYYIWVGVTLSLHIAIVPLVHLLAHAVQLNIVAWIPNMNYKVLVKLHSELAHFVAQPPLFDKPWLTRSVYDLWSHRWHQIFRPGFHQVAYNPIRRLFGQKHKHIGRIAGTIAVFACSGLMHDYIILAALGPSNYNQPGVFGYQTLFFMLQALATIVSVMSPRLPTWLSRTLTWLWVLYTAPLFVEPYLRIGLHHSATVPGFPKFMDAPLEGICPYGPRGFINN